MTQPTSFVVTSATNRGRETPAWFPEPTWYPDEETARMLTPKGFATTDGERFYIGTAEGVVIANVGDTIARGTDGSFSVRLAANGRSA